MAIPKKVRDWLLYGVFNEGMDPALMAAINHSQKTGENDSFELIACRMFKEFPDMNFEECEIYLKQIVHNLRTPDDKKSKY